MRTSVCQFLLDTFKEQNAKAHGMVKTLDTIANDQKKCLFSNLVVKEDTHGTMGR